MLHFYGILLAIWQASFGPTEGWAWRTSKHRDMSSAEYHIWRSLHYLPLLFVFLAPPPITLATTLSLLGYWLIGYVAYKRLFRWVSHDDWIFKGYGQDFEWGPWSFAPIVDPDYQLIYELALLFLGITLISASLPQ